MNNPFPDYRPKLTKDTIFDYKYDLIKKINEMEVSIPPVYQDFKKLMELLKIYTKLANKNKGKIREGNIILGANEEEFIPSDDELIESFIGDSIRHIIYTNDSEKFKEFENIFRNGIKYRHIEIYHMDVMGSGRFFYANKPKDEIIYLD